MFLGPADGKQDQCPPLHLGLWDEEEERAELHLPFRTAAGSSQEHGRSQTSGRADRGLQTVFILWLQGSPFAPGIQSQVQGGSLRG